MESEKALLGCLILEPELFQGIIGLVDQTYFINKDCSEIFNIMHKLHNDEKVWDAVDLKDRCTSTDPKKVDEFMDSVVSSVCYSKYLATVRKKYFQRKMIKALEEHDGIDEIDSLLEKYHDIDQSHESLKIDEIFDSAVDESIKASEGEFEFPTPYPELTAATGGFKRGGLTFIGGRPGHHKSGFLLNNVAHFLKLGKKVLLVDYEMGSVQVIQRLTAIEKSTPLNHITKGRTVDMRKLSEDQREEVKKAILELKSKYKDLLILREDLKLSEIKREIRIHKPDMVTIDHLQIFSQLMPKRSNETTHHQISDLCQKLKQMARDFDIPVIVPSQVTRSSEGFMPTLASLKESGGIEENADVVMNVFTPFVSSQEERDRNRFQVLIAKCRQGVLGTVDLFLDSTTGKITSLKKSKTTHSSLEPHHNHFKKKKGTIM